MARTYRELPKSWMRKPSMVTGERRQWFAALEQGITPRLARSPQVIACEHDDRPVNRTSFEVRVGRGK